MSTSNGSTFPYELPRPGRGPLRLRMAEHPGRDHLDGGWWPRSRDLVAELADLVEHFPTRWGRIVRALISPRDWDHAPRRLPVVGGYVKVGSFPRDDTHLIRLMTSERTALGVLVVPPGFTDEQGDEALLAAATPGNAHAATDLLDEVTDHPDVDPMDHWTDDGESWWGPHPVAPSLRTGR
ncbi:MAG: DUF5994 family protein [Nocardioidaceae bacterium]